MKLHDLQPAEGSRRPRTRVGRGIAAGGGKTAGRGTKGQKARAGGSIPPWFEGGQTPLHMRIPKLRGFKNRFKVEYEVVNIGAIAALAETGAFEPGEPAGAKPKGKAAPITINQEILRATGLVRTLDKPMKILGGGELSTALFVVADAFSRSAVAKIEAAGGSINVLEVPTRPLAALTGTTIEPEAVPAPEAPPEPVSEAADATEAEANATEASAAPPRRTRATKAAPVEAPSEDEAPVESVADPADEAPTAALAPAAEAAAVTEEAPSGAPAEDESPADDSAS
jgi:large subunit ribosomal protein L15